jgi:hypothetical protein
MTRTGIDNPWRPEGEPEREPEPLDQWIESGIPHEEAETWRNWRYRINEAKAWRHAGVLGGLQAAQWSTAGVTSATVDRWRAAAIDATEAVNWHEFGLDLEEAKRHKAAGRTPEQAWNELQGSARSSHASFTAGGRGFVSTPGRPRGLPPSDSERFMQAGVPGHVIPSYMIRQWFDDTALSWAKEGIDATEAHLWRELGLRPAEVVRLTQQGATLSQTVRDWWRAGIPIDEVAEWIGAGLKPEEAAEQRARGITAEHAATLRALRDEPT